MRRTPVRRSRWFSCFEAGERTACRLHCYAGDGVAAFECQVWRWWYVVLEHDNWGHSGHDWLIICRRLSNQHYHNHYQNHHHKCQHVNLQLNCAISISFLSPIESKLLILYLWWPGFLLIFTHFTLTEGALDTLDLYHCLYMLSYYAFDN